MKINVELLEGGRMPEKTEEDQAAYDCFSRSIRFDMEGGYFEIGLGFNIQVPKGFVAKLYSRSSVSNVGLHLANGVGLVDPRYGLEVKARFYPSVIKAVTCFDNIEEFKQSIADEYGPESKVAQLRIEKDEDYELVEGKVESTRGGFGSTGK